MQGYLFAVLGGVFICLQGVLSSRISSKVGLWETNILVHIFGLILTLIFFFLWGEGDFAKLGQVNPWYLPGICFGVFIVFCTIKSISSLGPTVANAILLITQLTIAAVIDWGGFFETAPVKLHFTKPLGLVVMIIGIVIFKLKDI